MNETWWVNLGDLDDEQKEVLKAEPDVNLCVIGPPGSGKTNILMLRANYVRSVLPRIAFITFTRTLTEFLRLSPNIGRDDQLRGDEIRTFMSWGKKLLRDQGYKAPESQNSFDADRDGLINAIHDMIDAENLGRLYDVIFVDEVQDFYERELQVLRRISRFINTAGDSRQAIWQHKEGLPAAEAMADKVVELVKHYRIGRNICRFADQILPPQEGEPAMIGGCNYNEDARPSSVNDIGCNNEDSQWDACIKELRKQVRYIVDEPIAVLSWKRDARDAFWARLGQEDDLAGKAILQSSDGYQPFGPDSLIRVMTVASAKGSECRAVHILNAEEFDTSKRELAFTAVTRAKTEVTLYHVGALPGHLTPPSDQLPDLETVF